MEIYYWFFLFFIMIFISFFTWTELFGFFIATNMILGGYLNYDEYNTGENVFFKGICMMIDIIKLIFSVIYFCWDNFTSNTRVGIYIKRYIVYLENNYQQIKSEIKKQIIRQIMTGTLGSNTTIIGTPRLSYDSDNTDED